MNAAFYRFRAELRNRWRAWLGLALLVGFAGGAVIALAAGARRTETAYDRFRQSQNAFDVLVVNNPGDLASGEGATAIVDLDQLAALPEVVDAASVGTFFAEIGAGVGVLVPPDDHIGTELNRFDMLEGRRVDPSRADEAVVSFTLADQYGIEIGDDIQLVDPAYAEAPADVAPPGFREAVSQLLDVLPDGNVTVVGIQASPGQFPPQIEGSGRYLVHVSPALYPLRAELAALSEGGDSLMVRLERGASDTDAFVAEVERLSGGEEVELVTQREFTTTVNRSFRTQAVALALLALLTAIAGVLIVGQLLSRLTLLESADNAVLAALGTNRGQRTALALLRATAIGGAGALVAVALAIALSPLFPTGLARTAEPRLGLALDIPALALGAVVLVMLVVALTAWPAWRAAGTTTPTRSSAALETRPTFAGRVLAGRGVPVPIEAGVRMALEPGRGRSAVPVRTSLLGVTLGIVTLVGALTFGASLDHLLDTPRLYGQSWDAELTTYDSAVISEGVPLLEEDSRVDAIAAGMVRFPFAIEGEPIDGLALDTLEGDLAPTILAGRAPRADDEIALGARTLRSLDVDVGDTVEVGVFATGDDSVPMQVVGQAVFPVFAEAGRLGDGAYVNLAGGNRVYGEPIPEFQMSVLLKLAPGAELDALIDDLTAPLPEEASLFVIEQGRPTDIVNFGRVEATPYLLGAILAALSIATLTYLLASAVRQHRRDLAILKTLGFVRKQVRATVAWQATTLIVVALLVGVPLGVAVGRWIWTLFADDLGVVVEPRVPWLAIVITVPVAVVVANLAGALPAASAARTRPAIVLRAE